MVTIELTEQQSEDLYYLLILSESLGFMKQAKFKTSEENIRLGFPLTETKRISDKAKVAIMKIQKERAKITQGNDKK